MDEKYFAPKIEKKWQDRWAERGTFEARPDETRKKFYCLEMLPYPSGKLHMGHVRNYSIGDALSWYKRLQGFNVLHPIGWDSFGQPAEQAAIQQGANPREWTENNISDMRKQLKALGIGYDWSREIAAHRVEFYKFDQWFFLKMLDMGLAYRKDSDVNWCPKCATTLSNEQASGGVCWRCGTPVEKQSRPQWFLKITSFAEELLDGMSQISAGWPERVLTMQRNWIGRSKGDYIDFRVSGSEPGIRVFTTRIDTIFGANSIVVAPDHPFAAANYDAFSKAVRTKIDEIKLEQAKPKDYGEEIDKDGIDSGRMAVNPFNGEEIPIWIGNYVMMSYGSGAVMSVPAHDQRDFEFATRFGLPIVRVIRSDSAEESKASADETPREAVSEYGILINSGRWNDKTSEQAIKDMSAFAEKEGFGEPATTYRLRDWGISRQRFWGAPIPIVYCENCGAVPVSYEDLPVKLPESAPFTGIGESPLSMVEEFVRAECPECGGAGRRETDTMDTFVDSAWYFFRYTDPQNPDMPFDPEMAKYWLPVDQYIGGIDHAVMHLLYTRFWTRMMKEIGLVEFTEPAKRLLTQGMVVAESFYSKPKERYVSPDDVDIDRDDSGKIRAAKLKKDGSPVRVAVEKMGKSKLNGVDPNDMISIYGSDSVRLFSMFAAPVENELVWQETGIEGAVRFLQRIWRYVFKWHMTIAPVGRITGEDRRSEFQKLVSANAYSDHAKKLRQKTHQTIFRITDNFEGGQFNTPVAALMELSNSLHDFTKEPENTNEVEKFIVREALESLILMLAPYAPHASEELWEAVSGSSAGILESDTGFPVADSEVAAAEEIEIVVQVNGKLRARLSAAPTASAEELEELALADEKIREYTESKEVAKIIVVPGRLVNIVVKG